MKCTLSPDQDGYGVVDGKSSVSVQLDGGASRFRDDQLGAASVVTVQWTVSPTNYDYIRNFFATVGSGAFDIDLIWETSYLLTYTAHLIPSTLQLISVKGLTYTIQASLEVMPNGVTVNTVAGPIADFNDVIVGFSVTPIFDGSLGSLFEITLSGNVTSSTLINTRAGQIYTFHIIQDASGNHTFVWPTSVKNAGAIDPALNSLTAQSFRAASNGNLYPIGSSTYN